VTEWGNVVDISQKETTMVQKFSTQNERPAAPVVGTAIASAGDIFNIKPGSYGFLYVDSGKIAWSLGVAANLHG